jgi:hypothetical protein
MQLFFATRIKGQITLEPRAERIFFRRASHEL